MFDLALFRERIVEVLRGLNGGELNVYGWPDAGPEYPCVTFNWPLEVRYHSTHARSVSTFKGLLTVMVASADVGEATRRIDEYAAPAGSRSIVELLEKADGQDAWQNLVVDRATNWRQVSDIDALAYDVELTVHA